MTYIWIIATIASVTLCGSEVAGEVASNSREGKFVLPITRYWNSVCYGNYNGRQTQGSCLDLKQCFLLGGRSIGSCGVLGSCCLFERSCYSTTRMRLSYFVSPGVMQPHCTFQIDLMNRDVCQIRLDFEEFQLAPPTSLLQNFTRLAYLCHNDSFTVTSPLSGGNGLGFTELCGRNDGQHIYIPVNASQGANSITLSFNLLDRNNTVSGTTLLTPRWRIRATQLECPGNPYDYSTFTAAVASLAQQHLQKFSPPYFDFNLLAPPGCLQYYTERSGSYMTFNYNSAGNIDSQYIGSMRYAICFRRTPDACGIRHTVENFGMGGYNPLTNMTDQSCDNTDYLFIPDGRLQNGLSANKFCGTSLAVQNPSTVTSYSPGPFYVVFNSDDRVDDLVLNERGFRVNYQIYSSCQNYLSSP